MRILTLLTTIALLMTQGAASADGERISVNRIIYQEKSLYRNIVVAEGSGYRCMKFGRIHALQTCISMENPSKLALNYTRGLLTGLYITESPRKVLILGLGGGVLPMALRTLDPLMEINTVELDPSVAKVARSHFGYKEDALLRTHIADARVFVRQQRRAGQGGVMI